MRFYYLGSHARFSIRVEARSTLRMSGTCTRRPESLRNKSAYERARPSHRACVRVDQWNVPHNSLGCIESIRTSIPRSPRFRNLDSSGPPIFSLHPSVVMWHSPQATARFLAPCRPCRAWSDRICKLFSYVALTGCPIPAYAQCGYDAFATLISAHLKQGASRC